MYPTGLSFNNIVHGTVELSRRSMARTLLFRKERDMHNRSASVICSMSSISISKYPFRKSYSVFCQIQRFRECVFYWCGFRWYYFIDYNCPMLEKMWQYHMTYTYNIYVVILSRQAN
jgi:hypothetical protein